MINFIYKLFNHDKVARLNERLEVHKARTEQLEVEVRKYKGYKLKYELVKLYVDDDEALLEVFEAAEKKELTPEEFALHQQAGMVGVQGLDFFGAIKPGCFANVLHPSFFK